MLYLDNAATTVQKPQCVIDAMLDAMSQAGNAARGVNAASLCAARIVMEARRELAGFFDYFDSINSSRFLSQLDILTGCHCEYCDWYFPAVTFEESSR